MGTLGVCTSSFSTKKDGYVNKTPRGWGYYQGDGKIGHACSANKLYGKKYSAGDIVDVEVRGCSLHFWLNGEDQGPAFTNLPMGERIFAAASLYNQNEVLKILSHS